MPLQALLVMLSPTWGVIHHPGNTTGLTTSGLCATNRVGGYQGAEQVEPWARDGRTTPVSCPQLSCGSAWLGEQRLVRGNVCFGGRVAERLYYRNKNTEADKTPFSWSNKESFV